MRKFNLLPLSAVFAATLFLSLNVCFAASNATAYLCEMGVTYYNQGKLNEALSEFNKALAAEPENEKAKYYVNKIFNEELPEDESLAETDYDLRESAAPTRDGAMQDAFNRISKPKGANQALESAAGGFKAGPVSITGEVQARAGFTDKDSYWRRANWDLNEKNWRILSGNALNRYENTYDPRIYDRLRVNLDANNEQESNGLGFHGNITVDPWSYTGKSSKINVTSAFGDTAQFDFETGLPFPAGGRLLFGE